MKRLLRCTGGWASAWAPATCANLIIGFDCLAAALSDMGDQVTVVHQPGEAMTLEVRGRDSDNIPVDCQSNIACIVIDHMCTTMGIAPEFRVVCEKGIPLASGLGGSAASAVAACAAFNALLSKPLPLEALLPFALQGEAAVCGAAHADNVAAALLGGLVLVCDEANCWTQSLPCEQIMLAVVHPQYQLSTATARQVLPKQLSLALASSQAGRLAMLVSLLYTGKFDQANKLLFDQWAEPARSELIPGFYEVQAAARQAGALGCSISGAGPACVAFATTLADAQRIAQAMQQAWSLIEMPSTAWTGPIASLGVRIVDQGDVCG